MTPDRQTTGAPRGRPRDPAREHRVLVATIEEYAERGWAGLTMDGVAKRAGVGKSTIYLRWTNKEDLLAAAVQRLATEVEPLDTGSVRGDIEVLVSRLAQMHHTTVGWGMFRILIDVAGSGEAVAQMREVNESHRSQAYAILERGVERGELRPGVPHQVAINALYGTLVIYRMMHPWDEMEGLAPEREDLIEQVTDFVMNGISPWVIGGADG